MAEFNRSIAIVVGINQYQNGVKPLRTAVSDATEISQVLKVDHGYHVSLLTDQQATLAMLRSLLANVLPKTIHPDDRLLFYFAGHGIAFNSDEGPEGYLIPQDAVLGESYTYLPMTEVHDALTQLSCRHFLGIFDCCFAGAFRWSATRDVLVPPKVIHKERYERFITDPAWQVITSAASDQSALDAYDLKNTNRDFQGEHSPFATALIEALQGEADRYPPATKPDKPAGDGVMTATELYLYLRERVEPDTESHAIRQTPGMFPLAKHDKGEYIFLSPGHPLNLPPAPPLDVSSNPYRGLESFNEVHQDLFFGRQFLTKQLVEFVINNALTIVLGASGSGKSSLVKAGLIPKIRQLSNWYILPPFRPGESPFQALNQVLASAKIPTISTVNDVAIDDFSTLTQNLTNWFQIHPQAHLLVVVDQLEELITLIQNEQEEHQFLEVLVKAVTRYPNQLHLVLTLRSDFEPQFRDTALEPHWQAARFLVTTMARDELWQAIEAPAATRVMYFEPYALVDQLIDEVANMPGALPLLSFALSELYLNYLKRQDVAKLRGDTIDRAMTQNDYENLGGVTRSLTQRAEQEYNALVQSDSAYERTVRNVMLRMVSVGGELARRRVSLSELQYPEPENSRVKTVLKRFETVRLLSAATDSQGQPYREPTHDALVRGWKRLLNWNKQYLSDVILQRSLTSDANQWINSSQKKEVFGLLWIEDPRLATALQLLCEKTIKITGVISLNDIGIIKFGSLSLPIIGSIAGKRTLSGRVLIKNLSDFVITL